MATPEEAAQIAAVYAAYDSTLKALREQVVALVRAAWEALTSWRDADVAEFVAAVVPLVLGGQQQVSALTAAYLAEQRAVAVGVPARAVLVRPADVSGAAVRNGTPPEDVYRRAGIQVWRDLAAGKPLDQAVQHGLQRAELAAATDLQLAKTHTARAVMDADEEVVGYRRVLTGDRSCGLCFLASSQRYHKRDLLPIHPGCDCAVAPIFGTEDVPQVLDRELVEAAHEALEERFGTADRGGRRLDYRKVLLTREHGELGPVLTVASHSFTSETDLR